MKKSEKVLDVNIHSGHIVCIRRNDPAEINPFRIYIVISAKGAPIRKLILQKYADFISVLCFVKDFFLEGIDTMCYTDMVAWVKSRTLA